MSELTGKIESIYLSSILQLLCNDKKTGVLRVRNSENEVRIYLQEGDIVYSMGSEKTNRLGYILRSKGLIHEQELWKCLQIAREEKQSLGKVLVNKDLISLENLETLTRWKVEQSLFNLFMWEDGEFEYNETTLKLDEHILTKLNTMETILEASQRADEMPLLKNKFPNDRMAYKLTAKAQSLDTAKLYPNDQLIFSLIDGKRTVKEIINQSGHDSYIVYKALDMLTATGLAVKSAEAPIEDKEDFIDYSTIIKVYLDVLQNVRSKLKKKIEGKVFLVFDQCIDELDTGQKKLFNNFSLLNPIGTTIQGMLERMKDFEAHEEGCIFLINTFDDLLLNLLTSQKSVIGEKLNHIILQDIENMLAPIHKYRQDSSCGIQIIKSEPFATVI